MHANAEHESVFGFRPNLTKKSNTGTSKDVASHSQGGIQDSEMNNGYYIGLLSFFFLYLFSSHSLISEPMDEIYESEREQGTIIFFG